MPPLADVLAQIDSEQYLDCLQQLAESLLRDIDGENGASSPPNTPRSDPTQHGKANELVGPTSEQLESSKSPILSIEASKELETILAQHSYAHPYVDNKSNETNILPVCKSEQSEFVETDNVQIDTSSDSGKDMFYGTYDEANDCITIVVTSEDSTMEEIHQKNIVVESDQSGDESNDQSLLYLDTNVPMLSPMSECSLSPALKKDDIHRPISVSPAHTVSTDFGYESVDSPLSEPDHVDLNDFWCESFSELFPDLA